jgi:hypothetical protein
MGERPVHFTEMTAAKQELYKRRKKPREVERNKTISRQQRERRPLQVYVGFEFIVKLTVDPAALGDVAIVTLNPGGTNTAPLFTFPSALNVMMSP